MLQAPLAFLSFSFSASAVYIVNDCLSAEVPSRPARSAEGTGVSEIEIELAFFQGSDRLDVWGSEGDDTVAFVGTAGARLNGDTDKDVTISGLEYRSVYGSSDSIWYSPGSNS